jgi:hypothetical protein
MPKNRSDLRPHFVNLDPGDFEWLRATYPKVGAAPVIRALVRRHREEIEKQVRDRTIEPQIRLEELDV